jgi:hypothetical protein
MTARLGVPKVTRPEVSSLALIGEVLRRVSTDLPNQSKYRSEALLEI